MKCFDNFNEAKSIIKNAILTKMTFNELRGKLPGMRKPHILYIVFDLMEELELSEMPFPDAMCRPRIKRDILKISPEGNINIANLLAEKGFEIDKCYVRPTIGKNKITLTVRSNGN